jgi:hypothetical protein
VKIFNIGVIDAKPWNHREIERVEDEGERRVAVENATLAPLEHRELESEISAISGAAPHSALAIDEREHRDRLAAERAWASDAGLPAHAYFADVGITQAFGGDIDAMARELVEDFVAALAQIADAAGRIPGIPIVADGEVGEHVDVDGAGQLVAVAGVADALWADTSHVFGEALNLGLFTGPLATLPEIAVWLAGDVVFVPRRAAAEGVVVVVGQAERDVEGLYLFAELHHAVVAANSLLDDVDGGVAGVFAAELPSPTSGLAAVLRR